MRHRLLALVAVAGIVVVADAHQVRAQDVARLARNAGTDGTVRFSYDARPDICGHGDGLTITHGDGLTITRGDGHSTTVGSRSSGRDAFVCEYGPAFVELRRAGGRVTAIELRVGRPTDGAAAEWPRVAPAEAAAYLLSDDALAAASSKATRDMVFAATVADTETWPRLLVLARDRNLAGEARRAAVFWLGQAAGYRVVAGLTSMAGDRSEEMEVRESAVFALSRMTDEAATDALMGIARNHSEPRVRRAALFWLAQSPSPRVVNFFEEILRGGG